MEFIREYKDFSLITLGNFFFQCGFTSFFLLPLFIKDLGGDTASIWLRDGDFRYSVSQYRPGFRFFYRSLRAEDLHALGFSPNVLVLHSLPVCIGY